MQLVRSTSSDFTCAVLSESSPAFYLYLGYHLRARPVRRIPDPATRFSLRSNLRLQLLPRPGGGFLGLQHIWSLCVEEQFYLLWPAALLLIGRRRAGYLAGFLIIASPLSRVVTYALLAPQHRAAVDRMFHSSIDTIMFGCLLALLWQNDRFNRLLRAWIRPWSMAAAICFLFLVDPLLVLRFRGSYSLVVGMTLEGISICLITLYVVTRANTLPGRILNTPILRHIGVISYSLYLWQNIFTSEAGRYFPLNLVATAVCAELSYWAVERPALRLRDRFW